jgi:hypothetical protein
MNNTELLRTVESSKIQTEEFLVNNANINTELSEEQLNDVSGGWRRDMPYCGDGHNNEGSSGCIIGN